MSADLRPCRARQLIERESVQLLLPQKRPTLGRKALEQSRQYLDRAPDTGASARCCSIAPLGRGLRSSLVRRSCCFPGAFMALANKADRNLLFGILALQMDFITRDEPGGAVQAWVSTKQKPWASCW